MNLDKQASKRMNCKVKFVNFEILIFIVNRQQKFPDFEQKNVVNFLQSQHRDRVTVVGHRLPAWEFPGSRRRPANRAHKSASTA